MELIPSDYTSNYVSFKHELDTELNKAADGFVKIGYLLKVARDTDVLKDSGYNTVAEFAQAEYGLTKDTVSRYININDRFSEGGYSPVLAGRYHNYGLAKLQEMLTLPDNIVEAIPEDISKEDIRTIKKEYAEEQQISDIEVAIEAAESDEKANSNSDILDELIKQYFHDNPDDYITCAMLADKSKVEAYRDILSPTGSKVIIGRIPGKGKYIATLKDIDSKIIVSNMRDPSDKQDHTWDDLIDSISVFTLMTDGSNEQTIKEAWQEIYGEPYPVKELKNTQTHTDVSKNTKEKPKKKKVEVVNKKKAEVEVVPEVIVEIESNEEEVAPAQPIIEQEIKAESEEKEVKDTFLQEEQKAHHSKLDTERHWSEVYDIIDDQYQQLKRCMRNYDIENALKFTTEIRQQILQLKEWPMKNDEE